MNALPQRPLSVAEAAEYLQVSKDAVRSWIKSGRLPARRLSKRITRIPWQSVAEFEQTDAPDSTVRESRARSLPSGTSSGARKADRSASQLERLTLMSPGND